MKENLEKEAKAKKVAGTSAEATREVYQGIKLKSTMPFTGMRKTIAEHMRRSLSVSAPVTVMGEIDMTEMVKLRNSLLAQERAFGARITYTDLLVFTVARVLRDYPLINASIIDNEIKIWEDINIAIAVSIEDGLIVPVIRNADKKSLVEISRAVETLAQKAKERTLTLQEVNGGTFTISNVGAVGAGWRFDTVIINQPQSAILATGGITDRAVVRDGQIAVRSIMTYSFTYDHRLLEGGGIVTRFLNSLGQFLENPQVLLASFDAQLTKGKG